MLLISYYLECSSTSSSISQTARRSRNCAERIRGTCVLRSSRSGRILLRICEVLDLQDFFCVNLTSRALPLGRLGIGVQNIHCTALQRQAQRIFTSIYVVTTPYKHSL